MKRFAVFTIIISLLLVFSACAKKGEQPKGPYLVKVGNATITQADLDREIKNLPEFAQALFQGPGGKEKFLDELIKKELLYQEALKRGLDKDPEFLKKIEDFKKITLISQLLEKEIETKAKVTEKDAKDYYEKHKAELASVSQIKASHILVKTEAEANKILESLKKGEDFAALAKKSSIDAGTAKNGGDLGYFSAGQMAPEIEQAALRLKPGEVGGPVKTKFGFDIIKVVDKKMGKPLEFEKIKNAIMQRISSEKQKEVFDSYVENLKKSFKVDVNKDAISKLDAAAGQKEEMKNKEEQKKAPTQESKSKKD